MRKTGAVVLVAWGIAFAVQAQVQITNFVGSGELTWTCPSGSVSTVEWASSLTAAADWTRHWGDLSDIPSTNAQATARVPMFYRVSCWTNGLFLSMPIGRTYVYLATATNGFTWTQEVSCVGFVHGSQLTNGSHYVLLAMKTVGHPNSDHGLGFWAMSASDSSAYAFDARDVGIKWQMGSLGTTWTNLASDPFADVMETTLKSNGTLSVPAGTFENVIWYHEQDINAPPPPEADATQDYWVKPGFFLLKYRDGYGEGDIWELESWRDE